MNRTHKFNFWLNVLFAVLNLGSFYVAGSLFNLVIGLLCAFAAFMLRAHA